MNGKPKERKAGRPLSKSAFTIALYLVFLILMILVVANKENYHIDELFSYGLANSRFRGDIAIDLEEGKTYVPAEEPFMAYMTVQEDGRFDYANVWKNQAIDVHPPLYYILLHTVCSLFPGVFSKWFAAAVNFLFGLLTLAVFRRLLRLLTGDERICDLVSAGFVLSVGILQSISFLRMYVMAMFWVTLLTAMLAGEIGKPAMSFRFLAKLYLVCVCAALTHYYCIVYLVLLGAVFCLIRLVKKEWRSLFKVVAAMALAGVTACLIYPAMVRHIFFSYRGVESFDALLESPRRYLIRIKDFFEITDRDLFGGVLILIIICLVALTAALCFRKDKPDAGKRNWKERLFDTDAATAARCAEGYALSLLPALLYWLIVTKIAIYIDDRYLFPIYAVVFGGAFCLLLLLFKRFMPKKSAVILLSAFLLGITLIGWKTADWLYLYKSGTVMLDRAAEHADDDCLCVYDENWQSQLAFMEARNYRSITFLSLENIEELASLDISKRDRLSVLLCSRDRDAALEAVRKACPQLTELEEIGTLDYMTSFFLSGSPA